MKLSRLQLISKYLFQRVYTRANKGQLNFLSKSLSKGSVFFDVGSNFGIFTFWAAFYMRKGGEIYLFEPQDELNVYYKFIAKLFPKVTIHISNFGLSSSSGTLKLSRNYIGDGGASFQRKHTKFSGTLSKNINLISLDEFINSIKIDKITLIKVDIERHEYDFVIGALSTLSKFKPNILIELDIDSKTCQKIISSLEEMGYQSKMLLENKLYISSDRKKIPHPKYGVNGLRDFLFYTSTRIS